MAKTKKNASGGEERCKDSSEKGGQVTAIADCPSLPVRRRAPGGANNHIPHSEELDCESQRNFPDTFFSLSKNVRFCFPLPIGDVWREVIQVT